MSSTLSCTFRLQSAFDAQYWWPLVFEAMRRIGFGYDNPFYFPERRGIYYPLNPEDASNELPSGGTEFRELWGLISIQRTPMLIEFWTNDEETFLVQAGVASTNSGMTLIEIGFPEESIPDGAEDPPVQPIKERLLRWLDVVSEVYTLCGPCSADIAWERWGDVYPAGRIDPFLTDSDDSRVALENTPFRDSHIVAKQLSGGGTLYGLDPWPVSWRGDWALVPLLGQAQR